MMVQGLIQIEAAKTVSHLQPPPCGWGLRKNGIKFLRGDSFIVRASCSADPDKRVHSISVMDPGFPVCGGEGGQMTHAHILLQLGYGGVAVSSSIGSREEHITLYFDINPYFNKSKSVWKHLCLQYMYTENAHYIEV